MDFEDIILESALRDSALRNGIPTIDSALSPGNIKRHTNKEFLLDQFNFARRTAESLTVQEIFCEAEIEKISTLVDFNKYLSIDNVVNIDFLTKSVNEHLKGKVFLGLVITKPTIWNKSTFFLAEDPDGERGVRIIVDNKPLSDIVVGTFVAVINPHFKTTPDGGIELRSCTQGENDIVILTPNEINEKFPTIKWLSLEIDCGHNFTNNNNDNNTEPKNIAHLRKEGNTHFVTGNYDEAIMAYTQGLSLCSDDEDLLANRSLCYLKCEQFKLALKDALFCLKKNPRHLKAIYRAAQAYLGLKEYEKAKSFLVSKLKLDDVPNKDLRKLLVKTEGLISQRMKGQYDMKNLYINMEKDFHQEISDYVGPVKIANAGLKGRGLVVTRDVKPGELILCSPAFAIHIAHQEDYFESISNLIKVIVIKLQKHPELRKELYKLSAGKEMGYLDSKDFEKSNKIDINRIRGILKVNLFRHHLNNGSECFGLWLLPSYINNDCYNSNCSNTLFGNVRQIRCMKPMKKGDEVLISYRTVAAPLWQLSINDPEFGMVCECNLCKYETTEPKSNRLARDATVKLITEGSLNHPKEVEDVIRRIESCSSSSPYLKYYLAYPRFKLGSIYFMMKDYVKARKEYKTFLDSWPECGGDFTLLLCLASERIYKSYVSVFDFVNAKNWKDLCLEFVSLRYGNADNDFLETVYPGITLSFKYVDQA